MNVFKNGFLKTSLHYMDMASGTLMGIVNFRVSAGLLDMRAEVARRKMKLPPYPLLEKYVEKTKQYGLVADEILVHPPKGEVFERGRDICDPATLMTVPASDVPEEAFGRMGVNLTWRSSPFPPPMAVGRRAKPISGILPIKNSSKNI